MSKRRIPLTPERISLLRARPVMHVADATAIYAVGRNRVYSLMRSGELKFSKIGGSTLLHTASLEAIILAPVEAAE
jgi:hypothetical protein